MKKYIEELYTKGDSLTGESLYYLDSNFSQPYNGWAIEMFKGEINWEFEIKNGKQNGIEKVYENGHLIQVDEYKDNLQYGVSKEYDKNGNLTSVSVVWNNDHIKTIYLKNNQIDEVILYREFNIQKTLPEYINKLCQLSEEELINYKFDSNNPHLDYP